MTTRFAAERLGDPGVYGLAVLTGFVDVDSFTLGLAQSAPALALARGAAGRQSFALLVALALAGLTPLLIG